MRVIPPLLDPPQDQTSANSASWAGTVLHVYNDDYLGIRSAASALPGHKLVLPRQQWSRRSLDECADAVAHIRPTRVVFHGISDAISSVVRHLAWRSPDLLLFGVYHGSPSQWNDVEERSAAKDFLRFDAEGMYHRSHILKPGADALLRSPSPRLLVNCAPKYGHSRPAQGRAIAFAPAPDIWRKNLYANALAVEFTDSVKSLWHYADLTGSPLPIRKSRRLTYRSVESHRDVLRACDLVLNVTIADCHPMVDLEANAAGRLSLHADYGLGVLQDHPAERLQVVKDPTNLSQICEGIDAASGVSPTQAAALARDLAASMTAESIERYAEFLDLV